MEYGYARISTREQTERRQLITLQNSGIARERIYVDRQSGKDFERDQYLRLLRELRCGDAFVVKSDIIL